MKIRALTLLKALIIGSVVLIFGACSDNEPMGKGEVDFEITDAPSDDASVKGVFVTVADVKIAGQSVQGFAKQTIDLKAYQEGSTKLIASGQQLDAKSYNSLTLVLDLNTDASGNSPGCYVLTNSNAKYKLKSSANGTMEVTINKPWSVAANTKSTVVMDFDLRKSIRYSDDGAVKYNFVSDGELSSAIRIVAKEKSGTIQGNYEEEQGSDSEKIIVYAYKKGSFNMSTETQVQGDGKILFANATTSAEVKQGITGQVFTLALLEEGEYELHFAAHKQNPAGRMTFTTMLESQTMINGNVGNVIKVDAGATVTVLALINAL